MTQNQIILKVLQENAEWLPSYMLTCKHTDWGWLGTSSPRRCRELAEEGKIFVRHTGKFAEYRWKNDLEQTKLL